MTEFKPRTAFLAYAAQVRKVKPDELDGTAIDPGTVKALPMTVGAAWACTVWLKAGPRREVRGWVTADGTVIAPEQNLGLLLAEAGVWIKPHPRTLDQIADLIAGRLVWAYGMNHAVHDDLPKMPPPELKIAPTGTGTLRFFSSYRQEGPGGAGGGPLAYTQNVIAFGADHKATLTRTPFTP